jgi:phosphoglycerate dehydrogenase-like enzyme
LTSRRAAEPPSRRVLVAHRLAGRIAELIGAARPALEFRARQVHEVTAEDLDWADTLVGFRRPPGLGNVRWIHSIGAGVDGFVDTGEPSSPPALQPSVLLTRASEPFGPGMGEYVAGRVLAACQHIPLFLANQYRRKWTPETPRRARGTRAIVVGTGEVGRGIAAALGAIGVRVTGVSRSGAAVEPASHPAIQPPTPLFASIHRADALPELVAECDWLVLAMPLTKASRGMIGRAVLERCRGAWLINVARGGVVDEAAMLAALDDGKLAGAALDVFEREPLPPDSPLWGREDVLISPHVAGVTTAEGAAAGFLECLEALERGEVPEWAVDQERGY